MTQPADDRDASLDTVLIGGREPVQIVIAEYDPQWLRRFAAERERIRLALGPAALSVEHIGSTAVPQLAAKPIIDVLLTVARVDEEASYLPPMEAVGYVLRVREEDHRMFRTPARDVHVHVYEPAHPAIGDYLALRDRLRASAGDRELYARVKRDLAGRPWRDMNDYADAKTAVITQILSRAR